MWPAMGTVKTDLTPPYPVSLRSTVKSHGWVMLAPWGWDDSSGVLSRSDRLSSGRAARIQATQKDAGRIEVTVDGDGLNVSDVDEAAGLVRRWLSLDWDPAEAINAARKVDPEAARTIEGGGGRLLRCSTFYEDFVKTVCTIQIAWSGSLRMVEALVDAGGGLFPTPSEVLDLGESGLRARGLGFRARSLYEGTEAMLDRGLIDESGRPAGHVTYDDLIDLWGIGPYAAAHMAVLQHDFSRVPVDSEVTSYCRDRYGIGPGEIDAHFGPWGDFRFLGYRLTKNAFLGRDKKCPALKEP